MIDGDVDFALVLVCFCDGLFIFFNGVPNKASVLIIREKFLRVQCTLDEVHFGL